LLDSMNVEAADIIGMSHGGVTGLLFALENPRRVRTLTLIEPPAFWVLPNHGYDDAGAREMQEFLGSLRDATITEADVERFRCLLGDCVNGRSPRQAPQWVQWVTYRNSLRGLYTIGDYKDDSARLRSLTIPTLVVNGAATVGFHRMINVALIRLLPHAEPLELAGGHNAPAADPEYFVAQWQGFLNRAIARDSRRPQGAKRLNLWRSNGWTTWESSSTTSQRRSISFRSWASSSKDGTRSKETGPDVSLDWAISASRLP